MESLMAQHVEPCAVGNGLWLPLTEYSVKSGVSLSTIRRKIKSNTIPFRLEKGRYLILFEGDAPKVTAAPPPSPTIERKIERPRERPPVPTDGLSENGTGTVRMISDAFEHALKDKEERIRLLEQHNQELQDQVNELRLLVRVLEEKYEVRY
jgi:hypothetical protein